MSIHKDSYMGKMRVSKQIVLLSPSMASWHAQDGPWLHLHQTCQPLRYLPLQQPPWTMLPSWVLAFVTLELHRCSLTSSLHTCSFPYVNSLYTILWNSDLGLNDPYRLQLTHLQDVFSHCSEEEEMSRPRLSWFYLHSSLRWFSSFPNTDWAEHALLQPAPTSSYTLKRILGQLHEARNHVSWHHCLINTWKKA